MNTPLQLIFYLNASIYSKSSASCLFTDNVQADNKINITEAWPGELFNSVDHKIQIMFIPIFKCVLRFVWSKEVHITTDMHVGQMWDLIEA